MCHGAGGMAAHVAFGARNGSSLVIVGTVLSALTLFSMARSKCSFIYPPAVLGVIPVHHGGATAFLFSAAFACTRNATGRSRGLGHDLVVGSDRKERVATLASGFLADGYGKAHRILRRSMSKASTRLEGAAARRRRAGVEVLRRMPLIAGRTETYVTTLGYPPTERAPLQYMLLRPAFGRGDLHEKICDCSRGDDDERRCFGAFGRDR